MESTLNNKSVSESNISQEFPSPVYVSQRNKRAREPNFEVDFNAFREEMKSMISSMFAVQSNDIKKIFPTLSEIQISNSNIEKSISFLSAQHEELKRKIDLMEAQAKKDKDYITILEDKLEDLQRVSRKMNVEIKNVPKMPQESKEDLINMVKLLSETVACKVEKRDIQDIYRIQAKNKKEQTKQQPIIVEMSSAIQKADFLKMAKSYNLRHKEKLCAKHLGIKNNYMDNPIFISEQLTAKGARLHFLARDLAKANQYKYCWTAYGRIYVRKDDNSRIIIVKNEAQVNSLMNLK
ncbi:PREDICTED: uncharacterized protein LOC106128852 [Papilio xuthus]|uniref:Uncharacterized protein LOC106128852 n=1 Tax=Papilio xuthus TaxID=66420 RepID=A0AAJ6ZZU6_PAPXU|nr:PREDICTED: uncharacterized protein LOC106128852 [Papilio xuthus]